jgi:hypothetical protein
VLHLIATASARFSFETFRMDFAAPLYVCDPALKLGAALRSMA